MADDESCVREALTAALRPAYVVHSAASGAEACARLRTHPIAAIILDAILEGEHGLDLVERFRAIAPAPILLLTGHGSEELAGRAVWAGGNGYLKKPPSVPNLHAALARLIPPGASPAALAAQARQDLDGHLAERFCPAEFAGRFGVSEAYLRRCFRHAYGKTPRRYVAELRIRRGALLLRTTSQPIERIGLDLGYPSSTMFGKAFRRLFGVSPSEYRNGERREA